MGSLVTFAVSGSADCNVAMFTREVCYPYGIFEVEVATIVIVKLPPNLTWALLVFGSGKWAESLTWDCITKMAILLLDDGGGSGRNEARGRERRCG